MFLLECSVLIWSIVFYYFLSYGELLLNIFHSSRILLEGKVHVLLFQILLAGPFRLLSRLLHRVCSKMNLHMCYKYANVTCIFYCE